MDNEEELAAAFDKSAVIQASSREYKIDKDFECGICFDDWDAGEPYARVAGDPVCKGCLLSDLKPKFEDALKDEEKYLVSWGSASLQPSDFPDIDDDFLAKWAEKEKVYSTPKAQRGCCQHLYFEFDGEKHATTRKMYEDMRRKGFESGQCLNFLGAAAETEDRVLTCSSCHGATCGSCGLPLDPDRETKEHVCDPSKLGAQPEIDKTLVRGRDYQVCPQETCLRHYALSGGCNAMVCTKCYTHFCYICGKRARHESSHWSSGRSCPRWGQPGTNQAMHDAIPVLHVIETGFLNRERALQTEAEKPGIDANERQMKLDQALCYRITGQARAFRTRDEEMEMRFGYRLQMTWDILSVAPLEQLLTLMRRNMDFYALLPDAPTDKQQKKRRKRPVLSSSEAKDRLRTFRWLRIDISGHAIGLRNTHGELEGLEETVFEAFPELGPLVER